MNIEYEWMCYWIVIQIRLEDFFLFIWFLNRRFFQKENICHWWWTCLLIFSQFYFHLPGPNGLSCFRSRSPSVWFTILWWASSALMAKITSLIIAPSPNFQYWTAISGAGRWVHIGSLPSSNLVRMSVYVTTACSSRYPTNLF